MDHFRNSDEAPPVVDRKLQIEIYSDIVCPWCYVGKRRLERALDQLGSRRKATVQWRPFQLNPTMSQQGMDRTQYLETKFGSLQAFKRMEEHLLEAGKLEHIPFAFEKIARTPNTFQAHRLIWYAGQQHSQDAMVEQLFKGYFEEGLDIGSMSVLRELAHRAELEADQFLGSEEGAVEVQVEESGGHQLGIRSVPHFMFERSSRLSGAQPVDVFVSAIEQILAIPSVTDGAH